MKLQPVIKWSGSKRSQAQEILKYMPEKILTYKEPFVGGGSVFGAVMLNNKAERYEISDYNETLISLWNNIKNDPESLMEHYTRLWKELNNSVKPEGVYYETRERLNKNGCCKDFMFILRTCVNGMPRYNRKGDFNTSFHHNRGGMKPDTLKKIVFDWSELINKNDVTFIHRSYDTVLTDKNDFLYLDPPYANTKGMYYGALDNEIFFSWLRKQKCKWLLSFDGVSGKTINTYDVPEDLYREHVYLESGNSSFKRTMTNVKDATVYESLYIK